MRLLRRFKLFFFMRRFHKYEKALKARKSTKKYKNTTKQKHKNANKRIKIKNVLKKHLGGKK